MKNLLYFFAIITLISCEEKKETPVLTVINGTVLNNSSNIGKVRGHDVAVEFPISETGEFSDTLSIETNGLYTLYIGREGTSVYLEKGKNLSVTVDFNEFDETLVYSGALATENNYLAAKYLLSEKEKPFQEVYAMNEEDFINEVKLINGSYIDLLAANKELSKPFIVLEAQELNYENIANIENYPTYHKIYGDKEIELSEDFFKLSKKIDFTDTTAFRNSLGYQRMLNAHINRLVAAKDENEQAPSISYLKNVSDLLPDGYAKDKLMFDYLRFGLKPDSSLDELFEIYKNSNPSTENLELVTERYNLLKPLQAGSISPTFEYENHAGGSTNLSDLIGKYVYIDVWATWCAPCLREIPDLKKIEKEYQNKNIAFVSISIDVAKDYDKWKEMVSEKELGGIQLYADSDWKSKFITDYAIIGIPRFILIDPEGKIISADAARPSEPELRTILDDLL